MPSGPYDSRSDLGRLGYKLAVMANRDQYYWKDVSSSSDPKDKRIFSGEAHVSAMCATYVVQAKGNALVTFSEYHVSFGCKPLSGAKGTRPGNFHVFYKYIGKVVCHDPRAGDLDECVVAAQRIMRDAMVELKIPFAPEGAEAGPPGAPAAIASLLPGHPRPENTTAWDD
jgi:hypothetical protein